MILTAVSAVADMDILAALGVTAAVPADTPAAALENKVTAAAAAVLPTLSKF